MKKPIGYKVGGVVKMPTQTSAVSVSPSMSRPTSPILKVSPNGKENPAKIQKIESTKSLLQYKILPRALQQPVQALESEKLEVWRNMIRDELSKQRKQSAVHQNDQLKELSQQVANLRSHIASFKSENKGLETEKQKMMSEQFEQIRMSYMRSVKQLEQRIKQEQNQTLLKFQAKIQGKFKIREAQADTKLDSVATRLTRLNQQSEEKLQKVIKAHLSKLDKIEKHKETPRIVQIESNINHILSRLQAYNGILDRLKDQNPAEGYKLAESMLKLAQQNKLRKKQLQQLNALLSLIQQKMESESDKNVQKLQKLQKEIERNRNINQQQIEDQQERIEAESKSIQNLMANIEKSLQNSQDFQNKLNLIWNKFEQSNSHDNYEPFRQEMCQTLSNFQNVVTQRLSELITEYNGNFITFDSFMQETRQLMEELFSTTKSLGERVQLNHNQRQDDQNAICELTRLHENIFSAICQNNGKIDEIQAQDLTREHEVRLLNERLDQIEFLGSRNRLQSCDSNNSERKPGGIGRTKQRSYSSIEDDDRPWRLTKTSLQDENVFDQWGLYN